MKICSKRRVDLLELDLGLTRKEQLQIFRHQVQEQEAVKEDEEVQLVQLEVPNDGIRLGIHNIL